MGLKGEEIAGQPSGPFILNIIYTVGGVCFMPGGWMTIASGYLFHQVYKSTLSKLPINKRVVAMTLGGCVCMVGTQNVAIIMMFQGRFLLRDYLKPRISKYKLFLALDQAVETEVRRLLLIENRERR
jgi:uncharacterized membrane protein YdjX (TVP38/TMEM64 family)